MEKQPRQRGVHSCMSRVSEFLVSSDGPEFTEVRFVSEVTVTCTHCVSWVVIHGCVFRPQTAHFQEHSVLVSFSGDGEPGLHSVSRVDCTTPTTNVCDPLQSLPWSLRDPVHSVATDGESRGCTGECWGHSKLFYSSSRLLTLTTHKHR